MTNCTYNNRYALRLLTAGASAARRQNQRLSGSIIPLSALVPFHPLAVTLERVFDADMH